MASRSSSVCPGRTRRMGGPLRTVGRRSGCRLDDARPVARRRGGARSRGDARHRTRACPGNPSGGSGRHCRARRRASRPASAFSECNGVLSRARALRARRIPECAGGDPGDRYPSGAGACGTTSPTVTRGRRCDGGAVERRRIADRIPRRPTRAGRRRDRPDRVGPQPSNRRNGTLGAGSRGSARRAASPRRQRPVRGHRGTRGARVRDRRLCGGGRHRRPGADRAPAPESACTGRGRSGNDLRPRSRRRFDGRATARLSLVRASRAMHPLERRPDRLASFRCRSTVAARRGGWRSA